MALFDTEDNRTVIIGTNACNFVGCKLHRFPRECKAKKERFDKFTVFHINGFCGGYDVEYYTLTHNGNQYVADNLKDFVVSTSVGESDDNLIDRAKAEHKKSVAISVCAFISLVVVSALYLWFTSKYGGVYR